MLEGRLAQREVTHELGYLRSRVVGRGAVDPLHLEVTHIVGEGVIALDLTTGVIARGRLELGDVGLADGVGSTDRIDRLDS